MRPQSLLIASVIVSGLVVPAMAQQSTDTQNANEVEEIYVAHSIRISTTIPPTAFCDKAPFKDGELEKSTLLGHLYKPVRTMDDFRIQL